MNVLSGKTRSVDHSFAVWSKEQLANIGAAGLKTEHMDATTVQQSILIHKVAN